MICYFSQQGKFLAEFDYEQNHDMKFLDLIPRGSF